MRMASLLRKVTEGLEPLDGVLCPVAEVAEVFLGQSGRLGLAEVGDNEVDGLGGIVAEVAAVHGVAVPVVAVLVTGIAPRSHLPGVGRTCRRVPSGEPLPVAKVGLSDMENASGS